MIDKIVYLHISCLFGPLQKVTVTIKDKEFEAIKKGFEKSPPACCTSYTEINFYERDKLVRNFTAQFGDCDAMRQFENRKGYIDEEITKKLLDSVKLDNETCRCSSIDENSNYLKEFSDDDSNKIRIN